MIFDLLTPHQGPRGRGLKKCAGAGPIHVSNSHTKFCWILSNGLGGDSITDGCTEYIFDFQAPPSPIPGARSRQQNENPVRYVLYPLFVRIQKKFGIKSLKLKFNDI